MSASIAAAPRVLVLGNVLAQPEGGVLLHAREVLPRAAALLENEGGRLALLEGAAPVPIELPASVERLTTSLPSGPPIARWRREGPVMRAALAQARTEGTAFDVVHSGHLPAPRGSLKGARWSWFLHDTRQLDARLVGSARARIARLVYRSAARRAAAIVVPSRFVRRELEQLAPTAAGKTSIAWHGVDHFEPRTRDAAPRHLLHLGHLEPRKNLELVIEALARDATLPPLVLAGAAKGDEAARLAEFAAQRNVTARVTFVGPVDDARRAELYATACCVVIPSRMEGFGIGVLEALAARAPLAIARAGALAEIAGPFAFSFSPDSAEECAAAIHAAMAQPESQLERGQRRTRAFTWDRAAAALVAAWGAAAHD